MNRIELLKKLTTASGISGHESEIAAIMSENLQGIGEVKRDNLGSIAFELAGTSPSPRILIVGHMDEIGFIVQDILPSGLMRVQSIGGWNPMTLMSSAVKITTASGKVLPAIFSAIPVHYLRGKEPKNLEIADLLLDAGAQSDSELKNDFGVDLGDPVIPMSFYDYQEKNRVMISKAFDDRVGVAAAIETAQYFSKNNHPNTLICAGSVQEEVGTRGAQTIAQLTKPDLAIIVEGAPADDFPGNTGSKQSKMGAGAHVRVFDPTIIVKKELKEFVIKIAKENNTDIQLAVRTGGGTDAKVIHLSDIGVPSIVFGVPVRYAHSHHGMISINDYDHMMNLIIKVIEKLDYKTYQEILK